MGHRQGRWWDVLGRWFGQKERGAGIFFDRELDGVLLHLAFGPVCEAVGSGAEAFLSNVGGFEDAVEIVRFAREARLPVDGWVCSGLTHLPYSVREVAAWLAQIEALGAPGVLIVRTTDLNAHQKHRLSAELVRRGCRLHERCAIEAGTKA